MKRKITHLTIAKLLLTLLITGLVNCSFAQKNDSLPSFIYRNWQVNVSVGVMTFTGDLNEDKGVPYMRDWRLGAGVSIEKEMNRWVGLRMQAIAGKLAGRNPVFDQKFTADIYQGSLQGTVNFSRLFQSRENDQLYRLYAMAGVGLSNWNTTAYSLSAQTKVGGNGNGYGSGIGGRTVEGSLQLGLGLNYQISEKFVFALETQFNGVNSDKLDALEATNKLTNKDIYEYTSVGIGYRFNLKKSGKKASENSSSSGSFTTAKAEALSNDSIAKKASGVKEEKGLVPSTVDVLCWAPQKVNEGEEFALSIQIYKAMLMGKGEIRILLPENYSMVPSTMSEGMSMSTTERGATVVLEKLPEDYDFTVKLMVKAGKNPTGTYSIYVLGRLTDTDNKQHKFSSVVNVQQIGSVAAKR